MLFPTQRTSRGFFVGLAHGLRHFANNKWQQIGALLQQNGPYNDLAAEVCLPRQAIFALLDLRPASTVNRTAIDGWLS